MLERSNGHTRALAESLEVCGLINVQYAVKDGQVYVLEANPRASRTVPFVAKATGVPLAMVAARVMVGQTLAGLRREGLLPADAVGQVRVLDHVSVKEAVLPFDRFPGVDTLLGPEMRSTGEVMGVDSTFGLAFAKSQMAAGTRLPRLGHGVPVAGRPGQAGRTGGGASASAHSGFSIAATLGTAGYLRSEGVPVDTLVAKVGEEGVASDAVELIAQGQGAAGREHAAWPGAARRRPAHPHGVGDVQGALPHDVGGGRAAAAGMADAAIAPARGASPAGPPPCPQGRDAVSGAPTRGTATLGTSVGLVALDNPVMTASGTSGHGTELSEYGALRDLGAVVVKSLSVEPWPGNPAPRVHEVDAGMLNSVGLQGPGLAAWVADDLPALEASGARVVVSIWGRTVSDYARAAELVAAAAATPAGACIAAVEVNVSCPNVEDRSRMFAHSAEATARVMTATACGLPRWAKLSPNVPDVVEIATGALEGGADGLTLVNTLLGLALDIESGQPALGAGGVGCPARPSTRWRCGPSGSAGRPSPTSPIVGVGGVTSGADAVELLVAGADAVQVGTAIFRDPRAPWKVLRQLARWCDTHATTVGQIGRTARRRAVGGGAGTVGTGDASADPTAARVPLLNEGGRDG